MSELDKGHEATNPEPKQARKPYQAPAVIEDEALTTISLFCNPKSKPKSTS